MGRQGGYGDNKVAVIKSCRPNRTWCKNESEFGGFGGDFLEEDLLRSQV